MLALAIAGMFPAAANAEAYFYCYVTTQMRGEPEVGHAYTDVMAAEGPLDADRLMWAWGDYAGDYRTGILPPNHGSYGPICSTYGPNRQGLAQQNLRNWISNHPGAKRVVWPNPPIATRALPATGGEPTASTVDDSPRAPSGEEAAAARDSEQARQASREAREAEWQAKLDKYEADKAARAATIAAQQREEALKQARHKAAQEAAERRMQSFRRVLAEHERQQREYAASEARHRRCVNGDQQACADIKAGKPALVEQLAEQQPAEQQPADAGEASTDTDPNRCVTTAEVRVNATFQGNTSASVLNGCGQPVDVRICLKRSGGWNCGVDLGVDPQEQAVHSSFQATGEVFVDARISGGSRRFADPPN